jgi:aryl-alcohol dehydrogenase-like predicted oxidoreductase
VGHLVVDDVEGDAMQMEQVTLGGTGLRATRIGLGTAALGRPGYINLGHGEDLDGRRSVAALRAHTHEVLDAAAALGVRYLDTARSYGRAEGFLAAWLEDHPELAARTTVGSKWGYTYTAGWRVDADVHEVKEHSLDVLQRQWSETQTNLGAHLDLYQIHSATLKTGVLENAEVLKALARLKEAGTAIGLTVSGPRQEATVAKAIPVEVDGVRLFDTVQATWNLLERSVGPTGRAGVEIGIYD